MNKLYQKALSLHTALNKRLAVSVTTNKLETIDSSGGVRHLAVLIFQVLSIVVLVFMLYSTGRGLINYFQEGGHSAMQMAGSVITGIVCLYAAFPISQLIRNRGESLQGEHSGMVIFVFGDAAKMLIRLSGELVALTLVVHAISKTFATIFNTEVFYSMGIMDFMGSYYTMAAGVLTAFTGFLQWGLELIHININIGDYLIVSRSADGLVTGEWTTQGIADAGSAYVIALWGLISLYISLSIYQFVYVLVASLVKWVSSPYLPVNIKNK